MVAIRKKLRGSYTVEATVVISVFCMLIVFTILLGFYGHDCAVMKSTANDLAYRAALWTGRFVSPTLDEVDYGALRQNTKVGFDQIESEGYALLEKRLLFGDIRTIQVFQTLLGNQISVEIKADFQLCKFPVSHTVRSESKVFKSKDLPRNIKETGEDK